MQKAKQLGLCDVDAPAAAAQPAPKKKRGREGAGDGLKQLAIDGGAVVEAKAARVYKPKAGSAQEAVLRVLFAAHALSDEGIARDELLQQAQVFTGA